MDNTKLLNLIKLSGGSNDIIKIDYLNNMMEYDNETSTSEYTESYLDGLDTTDIEGGKSKGPKLLKKVKGPKSHKVKSHKKSKHHKLKHNNESSPLRKKSTKLKYLDREEYNSDSNLETQVRDSFGKKTKPKLSNLSKLTQIMDSEEELGNIINNYIPIYSPTSSSSRDKIPSGISKLASISTQFSKHPPVNFNSLNQSYTIVPMLVPTSVLREGQFGGKINKKLEEINKQIEALENELF